MFRPLRPIARPLAHGCQYTTAARAKQRLVVLGSGWGGYNLARKVDKAVYDVTVVSPNSFFSFTPFLASTTVGTLEYRCATEPVRGIEHVQYAQGQADAIDFKRRVVRVKPELPAISDYILSARETSRTADALQPSTDNPHPPERYEIAYDKLVIATGCRSASFGIPGAAEHAFFLKDVRDARAIRTRLLDCLELASLPHTTLAQRRALLAFRIVGGGPTGVEFAAELHDFVNHDVYRLYPRLRGEVSITLYDVAPGILMSFDESLRAYAEKKFARDGVAVRGNSRITAVGADWLELDAHERHPFGLLVWSTGLEVNPFVASLDGLAKHDKTRAVLVDPHLTVLDTNREPVEGVFAIGDNSTPAHGPSLPATAQVASQQAAYMSRTLNAIATGRELRVQPAFEWSNKGSMVFVGDERALVDRSRPNVAGPKSRLAGIAAWVIWRSYYMTLAMSWRNKALVPMYWTLAFLFGRDVTRF
ncbi:hypothetical protein Q5752_002992 [Cryptotrichosporon argae]